ncbi:M23 family metallopeptidase [Sulfurimonas paralvinellae]|uniref:M23 family metallopeptidase n=1 Tax=Sulfurimonas paralvinellae TaxID=317658 RepID=A0A7M1B9G0_9BACT|nr:M23 family metallopeptidase [Sulfurimonas paralvinellae]QOP46315.1 M23 family metallopeptidase [Sulfurimonas paralvinellae]
MLRYLLLFVVYTSLFALNFEIVNPDVANGKTTLIKFKKEKGVTYKDVLVGKKRFPVFQNPLREDEYCALVGFSYYEKPATKELYVEYEKHKKREKKLLFLHLHAGAYEKETIKVDPSKVNPKAPAVKKRIAKEYAEAMKVYNHVSRENYLREPFILPIESKITSDFGKARVYNGSLKGYHSGTDFRAKIGTPIHAANDGKVVLVKKRFYSGGTVVLDHGKGIYTCYFHMSKFHVKKGEIVKRGEILGLSGKSGRVTGPHLHFSARINGVQVDPLQLIKLMNNNVLDFPKDTL